MSAEDPSSDRAQGSHVKAGLDAVEQGCELFRRADEVRAHELRPHGEEGAASDSPTAGNLVSENVRECHRYNESMEVGEAQDEDVAEAQGSPVAQKQSIWSTPRGAGSITATNMHTKQHTEAMTAAIRVANQKVMQRKMSKAHLADDARITCRKRVHQVNENLATKFVVGLVIFLNAFHVGLDTDSAAYHEKAATTVELVFTAFFLVEVGSRLYVERLPFFYYAWNVFDFVLVALACVDSLVLHWITKDEDVGAFSAIRIMRLARLARVVRLFKAFKELWLFVAGILSAVKTLCFATPIAFLLLYMFGTATTRIFGHTYGPEDDDMEMYFGSILRSMFTLFQCMTTEGWPDIARSAMAHAPWSSIFFVFFMTVSTFALTNVLVGVIVENAFTNAIQTSSDIEKRAEAERVKVCQNIIQIFRKADTDGNNVLSSEEFKAALKAPGSVKKWLLAVGIDTRAAEALFDVLDYDGSGVLDLNEFGEGLLKARGTACAQDVLSVHCSLWRKEGKVAKKMKELKAEIVELQRDIHNQFKELMLLIANREPAILTEEIKECESLDRSSESESIASCNGLDDGQASEPDSCAQLRMDSAVKPSPTFLN